MLDEHLDPIPVAEARERVDRCVEEQYGRVMRAPS